MFIEQFIEFDLRGMGPLVVHLILLLVIFMIKQNLLGQSLNGLLFTAKILHETMCHAFPYVGQITCKI